MATRRTLLLPSPEAARFRGVAATVVEYDCALTSAPTLSHWVAPPDGSAGFLNRLSKADRVGAVSSMVRDRSST
jgi:hypothetical protein